MRSMVVYGSFLDATEDLPAKTFKEVWLAVLQYGIDGTEPGNLSPSAKMAFNLAKPNIDANKKRRKSSPADNCEQLQTIVSKDVQSSIDVDVDVDVDVDEDVNGDVDVDVEGDEDAECVVKRARTREHTHTGDHQTLVRMPTIEAIMEENHDRGYGLSAESINDFVEYNNGKNWRMDWRKALEKWAAHERQKQSGARSSPYIEAINNRMNVVDEWAAQMEESG